MCTFLFVLLFIVFKFIFIDNKFDVIINFFTHSRLNVAKLWSEELSLFF